MQETFNDDLSGELNGPILVGSKDDGFRKLAKVFKYPATTADEG